MPARHRVSRLTPGQVARLQTRSLTYSPVGATLSGALGTSDTDPPAGFHSLDVETPLGRGDDLFDSAVELLMTWGMHARVGLRPAASSDRAAEGEVVRCRLGPLAVPCRVVWVLDEPDARGFGYGTLPGHPESGEEAFVVVRAGDEVALRVTAYSRPGSVLTRLAGPVGRWGQRLVVRRYAAALTTH